MYSYNIQMYLVTKNVRCSMGNQKGRDSRLSHGLDVIQFTLRHQRTETGEVRVRFVLSSVLSPCVADTRYTVWIQLQSITKYTLPIVQAVLVFLMVYLRKKTTIPAGTELALTSGTIFFVPNLPVQKYGNGFCR